MKLHPSFITDLDSMKTLDNLWISSSVPMFYDSACTLPIDNPCSMEVINLSDIRFIDRPIITIKDNAGNELYVTQPIMVDDSYGAAPAPSTPVDTNANILYGKYLRVNKDWQDNQVARIGGNMCVDGTTFSNDMVVNGSTITNTKINTWDAGITQANADLRYPQLAVQYTNPTWLAGIDASTIKTGTIDLARLPAMPSANTIVCTTIPAMTSGDQLLVAKGTVVIESTTGNTYRYSGSGSVVLNASYIQQSDLTPDWTVITNRPTTVSTWTNDAGYLTNTTGDARYLKLTGGAINGNVNFNGGRLNLYKNGAVSAQRSTHGFGFADDYSGLVSFWGSEANAINALGTAGAGASDGPFIYGYAGVSLGYSSAGTTNGDLVAALRTSGVNVIVAGTITEGGSLLSAKYVSLTGSYANPSWITALDPAKITQTASYRFATDTEKATWNGKQNAITTGTTAQYLRGDLSLATFPTTWAWSSLTGVPATFTPSAHTHAWADITSGKPTTVSGYGITDAITTLGGTITSAGQLRITKDNTASTVNTNTVYNTCNLVLERATNDTTLTTFPALGFRNTGAGFNNSAAFYLDPADGLFKYNKGTGVIYKFWTEENLSGDQTGHYHSSDRAWANTTGKPTTLSGYGITDAVSSSDSRLTDTRTPTNNANYIFGTNASGTTQGSTGSIQSLLKKSGFYSNSTWTDAPVANTWTHLIRSQYAADAGTSNGWSFEIAANFGSAATPGSAENYYMRCIANGTPTGWRTLWHTGNFDAVSALSRVSSLETRMTGVDNNWVNYLNKAQYSVHAPNSFSDGTNGLTYKASLAIGDWQYGLSASGGVLKLHSLGSVVLWNSSTQAAQGTLWHSGNFDPSTKSNTGHTHVLADIYNAGNYSNTAWEGFWPSGVTKGDGNFAILWKKDNTDVYLNGASTINLQTTDGTTRTNRVTITASTTTISNALTVNGYLNAQSGQFTYGTYVDPESGVPYGLKVSGGLGVSGKLLVNGNFIYSGGARQVSWSTSGSPNAGNTAIGVGPTGYVATFNWGNGTDIGIIANAYYASGNTWTAARAIGADTARPGMLMIYQNGGFGFETVNNATTYAQDASINSGWGQVFVVDRAGNITKANNATFTGTITASNFVANNFVQGSNLTRSTRATSLDAISQSGFYDGSNLTGTPSGGWDHIIHREHVDNNGYSLQIQCDYFADNLRFRRRQNTAWQPWNLIWHDNMRGVSRSGDGGTTVFALATGSRSAISNGANSVAINRYEYSGFFGFVGADSTNHEFYGITQDHTYNGGGAELSLISGSPSGHISFHCGTPAVIPAGNGSASGCYMSPRVGNWTTSGLSVTGYLNASSYVIGGNGALSSWAVNGTYSWVGLDGKNGSTWATANGFATGATEVWSCSSGNVRMSAGGNPWVFNASSSHITNYGGDPSTALSYLDITNGNDISFFSRANTSSSWSRCGISFSSYGGNEIIFYTNARVSNNMNVNGTCTAAVLAGNLKLTSYVIANATVLPTMSVGEMVILIGDSQGPTTNYPQTNNIQTVEYRNTSGGFTSVGLNSQVGLDMYGRCGLLVCIKANRCQLIV